MRCQQRQGAVRPLRALEEVVQTGAWIAFLSTWSAFMRSERPSGRQKASKTNPKKNLPQRVKEALRKSEEKFSKAFRNSPMALALTTILDDRYLEINDTFEELTGWTRTEVIGRTPNDILLWAKPDDRAAFIKKALSGDPVRNLEIRFRTKMGELRIGLGSMELIDIDGEPCALWVIADITEVKRGEDRLRQKDVQLALETHALWRLSRLSSLLWRTKSLDEGLTEMLSAVIVLVGASKGHVALFD